MTAAASDPTFFDPPGAFCLVVSLVSLVVEVEDAVVSAAAPRLAAGFAADD